MPDDRPTLIGSPWDALESVGESVGDASQWLRGAVDDATTALGRSVKAATQAACASASNAAEWVLELSPGGAQATVDLCTPFWEDNGSGPPSLVSPPPPFTGGQCDDVLYSIQLYPDGTPASFIGQTLFIRGPISGFSTEQVSQFQRRFIVTGRGGTTDSRVVNYGVGETPGRGPIVRVDGAPDNCGDPPTPPPEFQPNPNPMPDPGYDPGEEPYVDPTGRPVIPLPPITDPFGRPIRLPDIKLPDFSDPLPFGPSGGAGGFGPGVPGDAVDTGVGGDAEGSEPGKVLVGVQLTLTVIPSYARIVETASENFYVGACYVYLGLPGRLDLQEEGRFVKTPQFFYAPMPSDSWRVVASPGYGIRVTPYYVQETQLV